MRSPVGWSSPAGSGGRPSPAPQGPVARTRPPAPLLRTRGPVALHEPARLLLQVLVHPRAVLVGLLTAAVGVGRFAHAGAVPPTGGSKLGFEDGPAGHGRRDRAAHQCIPDPGEET